MSENPPRIEEVPDDDAQPLTGENDRDAERTRARGRGAVAALGCELEQAGIDARTRHRGAVVTLPADVDAATSELELACRAVGWWGASVS